MKDVLKANYACARDFKAAWIPVDIPACEVKGTLAHSANDVQVASISPQKVKRRVAERKPLVLLDVREEKELTSELGHLPGVKHIPIGSLAGRLSVGKVQGGGYCGDLPIRRRADSAAQILMQAGFKNVYVMAGGMTAWNKAGFPIEVR